MKILLWMIGAAFMLMWLLDLVFQISGLFAWFLLGLGAVSLLLGFRASEEM